ncbi:hypothetical protein CWE22_03310 [Pseudidiomarina aestuarii]|uniref:DUF3549 domain-containing protein n=1 Tax=Pseudidiomarina aestuarii TaxID=624146 RepID=A0A7Z7ETM8_9GAMM|nr:DUF3549 family protein [Pseudidiomarina aestuarii]RUO41227.1 hypothetical protein CWE22_03310 [Pseudidiomarina aestuarii]
MSQTDHLSLLPDLLEQSGSAYHVYDCGRRLEAITEADFQSICMQRQAHPYPFQNHAWLAIEFWDAKHAAAEHFLWFLKFPIDERGLISLAAQQAFVASVLTLLGQQITGALNAQQEQELQQSPYLFTPTETQRAALYAQLSVRHQRAPSIHFELAQEQLRSAEPELWHNIGLQGLHDVAARLNQDPLTSTAIAKHFSRYPAAMQKALAEALEHHCLPGTLAEAFTQDLLSLAAPDLHRVDCLYRLRALASQSQQSATADLIDHILQHPDADQLVLIGLRFWSTLIDQTASQQPDQSRLYRYIHALAQLQQQPLFNALMTDLLRLPSVRPYVLMLLQRHDLPTAVQSAWQEFIAGVTDAR